MQVGQENEASLFVIAAEDISQGRVYMIAAYFSSSCYLDDVRSR